jgi:hypothetical protein
MANIQALRGTSVTVTETFRVDGTPNDLDSGVPAIVAKFPDGTALTPAPVASGAWTGRTTGQYRIVFHAQPEVTWLDPITWVGTIGGEQQTLYSRVEWVGEHLFNIAAFRAITINGVPQFTAAAYPDSVVLDTRAQILDEFEQILGFSPVPRFAYETHSGAGSCLARLDHHKAGPVLSVAINGVAQSVGSYTLDRSGVLRATTNYLPSGSFQYGAGNVAVGYVHGWSRIMGRGSNIAMLAAGNQLQPGFGSTARSVTVGDTTYDLGDAAGQVTAAGTTRHYGIPVIDAWLNRWAEASPVVA